MNEPIICLDNMAERFGLTATPSGVSPAYLVDGFHFTKYDNLETPGNVQIDMSGDCWVDTVIVDSLSVDGAATIATSYNGGTTFVTTVTGLSKGTNLIRKTSPVWTNTFRILITTALGIEIRHVYIGLRKTMRYPKSPFVRKAVVPYTEDTETGGIVFNQRVIGRQKTLDVSFGTMSVVEAAIADQLIEWIRIGKSFWYFSKPDSEPLHGSLFAISPQEISMPYVLGSRRNLSLSGMAGFVEPQQAPPLAYEVENFLNVSGGIEIDTFASVSTSSEVESYTGVT